MAKRFIDTNIFTDSWFMNLPPESKLFYIYLITNCDHAGIIDLNIRLAEFQTGIEGLTNSLETVIKQFGKKRMVHIRENYYFLPKFINYQYPNGLNKSVKAHHSVIERLNSFQLSKQYNETLKQGLSNSLITVQDKDKDIDKDKDKDKDSLKGGVGEKINFADLENTQWFESVLRFFQGKVSMEELRGFWKQYQDAMIADDDLYRDAKDYRAHFRNWVKIQVEKQNNQQTGLVKRFKVFADEEA
ncbi:MAG: hypothetical protein M0P69_12675 [Bacteroidales bacterium]|nr:hypothetical protein [Bacteroidales bacterium]